MAIRPRILLELIELRRREASIALGHPLPVTFDFGEYDHFKTARGFGVTFIETKNGHTQCHMRYADKCLCSPITRFDAILRHELGHVADALIDVPVLNAWAQRKGYTLNAKPERRADDIANAIWGEPIRYDKDTVQSTRYGKIGRPDHLPQ